MRKKAKISGIYKDEKSGTRIKYEDKNNRNKNEISGTQMRYQEPYGEHFQATIARFPAKYM